MFAAPAIVRDTFVPLLHSMYAYSGSPFIGWIVFNTGSTIKLGSVYTSYSRFAI